MKKEKLIKKAGPFINIWNFIEKNHNYFSYDSDYSLQVLMIGESFEKLFDYIRNENINFIYIDGIGINRVQGLLCIEEIPQLATAEDCFFVGTIEFKNNKQKIVISARQLQSYLGEEAKFLVCKVITSDEYDSLVISLNTFIEKLEGINHKS